MMPDNSPRSIGSVCSLRTMSAPSCTSYGQWVKFPMLITGAEKPREAAGIPDFLMLQGEGENTHLSHVKDVKETLGKA